MIAQPDADNKIDGFYVLDIREEMLDARNPPSTYRRLVEQACRLLHQHGKVVVCCSAGVSRSNAIAIGVLVRYCGLDFDEAYDLVKSKVPIANPLPCHLNQIRKVC